MKATILFLIMVCVSTLGLAQNEKKIDSLRQVIESVEGAEKMEPLNSLLNHLLFVDQQEVVRLSRELGILAKENKNMWMESQAHWFRARVFQMQSRFDSLLYETRQGIALTRQLESDAALGGFYNFMGIYHEKVGSIDSALYYYNLALKTEDANKMALYSNIGLAYSRKGSPFQSIEYLGQAMAEAQRLNNTNVEAIIANNIGQAHSNLGNIEQARNYFNKSIKLKQQIGDHRGKLFAYASLLGLDLPAEQLRGYLNTAQQISQEVDIPFFIRFFYAIEANFLVEEEKHQEAIAISMIHYEAAKKENGPDFHQFLIVLGNAYTGLGEYEKAKKYSLELLSKAIEKNTFEEIQQARATLLKVYEAEGNHEAYYNIAKDYFPARDSISQKAAVEKLAFFDNELKNIEQEKEIELLNQTLRQKEIRRAWMMAVAGLIALVLLLILYFRNRQVNIQRQMIKQEQKAAQELAAANAELKNLDEMKTRFFSNISHELRTPLTLILTPLQQAFRKHTRQLNNDLGHSLQVVQKNAKRLLSLVEELLELSKIEAGVHRLNTAPLHLFNFCKQLFNAHHSKAEAKQIDYQFSYDLDEKLHVLVDKKRLEKIINNLLSNALKFTPKGGSVLLYINILGVLKTPRVLIFKIKDTGRGIPPEDLPHVFDRYYQTKRTDLPTEGGTGIGLALAKELAELMGGNLQVTSKWEMGSTFTLQLPLQEVEPVEMEAEPVVQLEEAILQPVVMTAPQPKGEKERPKLLIVEDNPEMQELLYSILRDDYHCLLANDGQEAWELLQQNDPAVSELSLIVSDIMMPHMDGYELLKHIKKHLKWRRLPVIMLTAKAAEESKLKALRMGVDDYLIKPFSTEELLVRVANLILHHQQRQVFNAENPQVISIEFDEATAADQSWLQELEAAVLASIDKKLEVKTLDLADHMAISGRQLLRRLKALTGLSTKQYVQEVKLQKARHLLENKAFHTISEVAYDCGFNTPTYFSKIYEKHYGKRPSDYFG